MAHEAGSLLILPAPQLPLGLVEQKSFMQEICKIHYSVYFFWTGEKKQKKKERNGHFAKIMGGFVLFHLLNQENFIYESTEQLIYTNVCMYYKCTLSMPILTRIMCALF